MRGFTSGPAEPDDAGDSTRPGTNLVESKPRIDGGIQADTKKPRLRSHANLAGDYPLLGIFSAREWHMPNSR